MTTLADRLRPSFGRAVPAAGSPVASRAARAAILSYDVPLVLGASFLIALSAQVAIPLPFSPVPVTAQTLALLILAAGLGRVRAAAAALCYLAEGASGLPVFAGGSAGPHVLAGPTGGYLAGFVPAAWLVGALAERGWDRHFGLTAVAMLAGNAVVLALGAAWLGVFVGVERAIALGVVPFLFGDLVKSGMAALLLPLAWRALGRRGNEADVRP